jgi:hypothetical protein
VSKEKLLAIAKDHKKGIINKSGNLNNEDDA